MSKRHGGRQPLEAPQHRLTVRPNEILERRPLLQALEQMDSGDVGFRKANPGYKHPPRFWENQPPLDRVTRGKEDFTGQTWGRMTVVGFKRIIDGTNGKVRERWICRCACGLYEGRKADSLRARRNPDEHCHRCNYLRNEKRIALMLHRLGPRPVPIVTGAR